MYSQVTLCDQTPLLSMGSQGMDTHSRMFIQ